MSGAFCTAAPGRGAAHRGSEPRDITLSYLHSGRGWTCGWFRKTWRQVMPLSRQPRSPILVVARSSPGPRRREEAGSLWSPGPWASEPWPKGLRQIVKIKRCYREGLGHRLNLLLKPTKRWHFYWTRGDAPAGGGGVSSTGLTCVGKTPRGRGAGSPSSQDWKGRGEPRAPRWGSTGEAAPH